MTLRGPRLCIDGRMAHWPEGTGVATYSRTLAVTLAGAGIAFETLLDGRAEGVGDGVSGRAVRWLRAAVGGRARARAAAGGLRSPDAFRLAQLRFSLRGGLLELVADGPPGIMHWTYPLPLRVRGWHNVYTIHDLVPLTRPTLTAIDPRRHRRLLGAIVRGAAAIVTVSQAARAEIIELLKLDPRCVANLSQAVLPAPAATGLPDGLSPGDYFLVCGTIEPRKNLVRLVAAHRASGTCRRLVFVGPQGWHAAESLAAIDGAALALRLAFSDRATVTTLIRHARALLFPSLAEGFGLPIAEAMALGTPILTSAGGATEETAGGAALLVDPLDVAAIAAAIGRLDGDDALCAALAAAGLDRARAFDPGRYGDRLRAFYADLAARQGQQDD